MGVHLRRLYPAASRRGLTLTPPTWESGLPFQPRRGVLADSSHPALSVAPGAPALGLLERVPLAQWRQQQEMCSLLFGGQKPVIRVSTGPVPSDGCSSVCPHLHTLPPSVCIRMSPSYKHQGPSPTPA